jgi:lipopolysaccharide assembly outer membrane protein LptD (OstA)
MRNLSRVAAAAFAFIMLVRAAWAQEQPTLHIEAFGTEGRLIYDVDKNTATATNGVVVRYEDAVLTARQVSFQRDAHEVTAEGDVRLQRGTEVWLAEQLSYNFLTRQITSSHFRSAHGPFLVAAEGLRSMASNQVYSATNALVSTDDWARPGHRIEARSLTILPGNRIEARHARVYLGDTPVFYLPYYTRRLEGHPNHWILTPGSRSSFGPYLLSEYHWQFQEQAEAWMRFDYRLKRGVAGGPGVSYNAGRWGRGQAEFYYAHDEDPGAGGSTNVTTETDRIRFRFTHNVTLRTNLNAKLVVRQQSDAYVVRDFFESEYQQNVQPSSFLEVNQAWENWGLNLLAQPQVNDAFETVERLPDVKLTGLRQQVGKTPVYYESDSSLGYFRHEFANGVSNSFAAWRADSFHQLTVPQTFFGWLTVGPRVGGRFTHYSETDGYGSTFVEQDRWVFNTGAEVSTKASRIWRGAENRTLDVRELRHILEPSVNYVYVPRPDVRPFELPQFDSELGTFELLPLTFPEYNAVDSIDSQHALRLSLRQRLQTKRAEGVDNLANWAVYTDWRLQPEAGQGTFADLFSDLDFKPRSWLVLSSQVRFDVANERLRLAHHTVTVQPGNVWSVQLGHRYLRDDPLYGPGNNLLMSSLYLRLNENWGTRFSHRFEARDGTMEEQYYTVYRDFRSWTAALTFRVRDHRTGSTDFGVGVTFSLKAFPRFEVGRDRDTPSLLLGS